MKEFRSNNFSLHLFSDNSDLYLALRNKLQTFSKKEDIQFLRDTFRIYTRENLSTNYLSLKLVEDKIPSLLFEIVPFRLIVKQFLKYEISSEIVISDLACVLLIESILIKEKKILANKKVLRQLAGDIFQFWKESLISYSLKEEKVPSNIKEEYDSVIRKFIKLKGNKKIELEYLYDACASGKSKFISKEETIEKFGNEILFYGVSEIDPLHFKVLEILSSYVPISFFISAPRLHLIQKNNSNFDSIKLNELVHEWSILSKLLGDKKVSDVEKLLEFSFLSIPEDSEYVFYESQEAYREIEFIGRDILRLVEERKDDENFKLTSIKLILPADDLNYSLLVSNTFQKMEIPHSFTKDIRKKKSPYFFAVHSILKLAFSDFDKESVFSLFYNPCFYPQLEDSRIKINPDIWNQIVSRMNLSVFLDKDHKKKQGLRETNLMTWERLWARLNSILIGDTSRDSIHLEVELLEEVYQFLEISSSLLQDLIGFKEDFSTLSDFSKFFKIILDTYLYPSMRDSETDEIKRINEIGKEKVYKLLSDIESIDQELFSITGDNSNFSLDDFVDILLSQMESWAGGDSRVLKSGVVVGELMDVIDPTFEFVYLVGLDERRFNQNGIKHDTVMIEEDNHSYRVASSLKLKNYFYHIFNHKAKKYTFSYVSLDTIKDREYYPARDLENIRLKVKSEFQKIPLFSYLEYKMPSSKIFEKETFDLIELKQKEMNLSLLKNAFPDWQSDRTSILSTEIDRITSDKKLNQKMKSYFFRSSVDDGFSAATNMDLSVNKFISYLECPKKFFFEYSVNTDEESNALGELDAIDSLRRHTFIKETLSILLSDPKIDIMELVGKIFNSQRVEMGQIPFGVLGRIAELNFTKYVETQMIPFFYNSILGKFKISQNVFFNSAANKTNQSILFSTPTIWDTPIKAHVDFLMQTGDVVYLTFAASSKDISIKKQIVASFTCLLLNQSELILQELKEFYQLKKVELRPAILHFPIDQEPELQLGQSIQLPDEFFKKFWESLKENQYPAFPISESKGKDICEYCPVNTVCHGYQTEFQPFLEDEMEQIIKLVTTQFHPTTEKSIPSGKKKK